MRRWFPRHHERGQLLPLLAISVFAMLAMIGLAVDLGYWRYQQRLQQSATDSAVIAAAIESNYATPQTQASLVPAAGYTDAQNNGFTNGIGTVSVTINYPPAAPDPNYTAGPDGSGKYDAVEAIITKTQPQFFSGITGAAPIKLRTRAVAIATNLNSNCVYALNQNAAAASAGVTIAGAGGGISETLPGATSPMNFAIYAPACGVITDSVLTVNGGAANVADQTIGFVSSNSSAQANFYGGQPTLAKIVQDPCPSIVACNDFTTAINSGSLANLTSSYPASAGCTAVGSTVTCTPGVYSSPISYTGNETITFAPGVYVLNAGLNLGGTTSASGTGVTFYNAGTSSTFTMAGTGNTKITAPTLTNAAVDPYNGLVFYQNPLNTNAVTWGGKSNVIDMQGVAYMPKAELKLNGNAPEVTALIANDIAINGGGMAVKGPNTSDATRRHFVLAE